MQDKPAQTPQDSARAEAQPRDNLIVADRPDPPGVAEGVTAIARVRGHKMATERDRRGRAGPEIRPDHRLRHGGHPRPASTSTSTIAASTTSPATTTSPRPRREERAAAGRAARDLRGLSPRERQGRHAQLHRHPDQRELLGLGRPLHRRRVQPLRHPRRLSRTSTASCPSSRAPAAAWPARARASR